MASNANIAVNDGESTPVTRTYNPSGFKDGGVIALYEDRTSGVPAGYGRLTLSRPKEPQDKVNGSYKCSISLFLPKMETVSGSSESGFVPAPRVAFEHVGKVEFWLPVRGGTQDRKNLRTLLLNLLNSSTVTKLVDDIEFVW